VERPIKTYERGPTPNIGSTKKKTGGENKEERNKVNKVNIKNKNRNK
jgi:hypothetical protein